MYTNTFSLKLTKYTINSYFLSVNCFETLNNPSLFCLKWQKFLTNNFVFVGTRYHNFLNYVSLKFLLRWKWGRCWQISSRWSFKTWKSKQRSSTDRQWPDPESWSSCMFLHTYVPHNHQDWFQLRVNPLKKMWFVFALFGLNAKTS